MVVNTPAPPAKKFLTPKSNTTAPTLPRKLNKSTERLSRGAVKHAQWDDVYTALKAERRFALPSTSTKEGEVAVMIKCVSNGIIYGLKGGKVCEFSKNRWTELAGSGNRNISNLVSVDGGILAQHASGQFFVVNDALEPIQLRANGNLLKRSESEIWICGARETVIYNTTSKMITKTHTHFVGKQWYFVSPNEVAVISASSQVDIYSLSSNELQPASLLSITLSPENGPLIRVFKCGDAFICVHSQGKMIIQNAEESFVYSLGLDCKITCALIGDNNGWIWLGTDNGFLIVFDGSTQTIIANIQAHDSAISKLFISKEIVSIDSGGQVAFWDGFLKQYQLNRQLWLSQDEYCSYVDVKVRVCSWNVGAQVPTAEANDNVWRAWLGLDEEPADILIIGLQEIVELEARKSLLSSNTSTDAIDNWSREIKRRLGPDWRLIHAASMVGLGLAVFVRDLEVRQALSQVGEAEVKTGLGGLHGNKGALCWRSFIHDTPVAFAVAHLAAGQKAITDRNNDFTSILKNANLPPGKEEFSFPSGNTGNRILDHCAAFVFGDLNYRVEMDRMECEEAIKGADYERLQSFDQLASQIIRADVLFNSFSEASQLAFAPTYKYDPGTVDVFDSSEKRRVPAWCDRILIRSRFCEIQNVSYSSVPEATASDHKPIFGTFILKCRKIDYSKRDRLLQEPAIK